MDHTQQLRAQTSARPTWARLLWAGSGLLLVGAGCTDDAGAGAGPDAGFDGASGGPIALRGGPDVQDQYRGGPDHLGLSPGGAELALPLRRAWASEPLGVGSYSASKSSPALDASRLYVGMDDGALYALERDDGRVAWRFRTRRAAQEPFDAVHYGIHASPALDTEHVYVGDYAGYLYAVSRSEGERVWERQLGDALGASPVLHDGVLYVVAERVAPPDATLFALDPRDGTLRMQSEPLGAQAHGTPTLDVDNALLFVGDNAGVLHALDLKDGQERWRYQAGAAIKSTAALHDGTLYVTSWDRALYALDARTGRERFRYLAGGPSMSSPSVFAGLVLFGASDDTLHAVDARTGRARWRFAAAGEVQSSPTVVAESTLVLVGSRAGMLYALDAASGELGQALALGADVTSVPVVVDGELYVTDDAGRVFRFDTAR